MEVSSWSLKIEMVKSGWKETQQQRLMWMQGKQHRQQWTEERMFDLEELENQYLHLNLLVPYMLLQMQPLQWGQRNFVLCSSSIFGLCYGVVPFIPKMVLSFLLLLCMVFRATICKIEFPSTSRSLTSLLVRIGIFTTSSARRTENLYKNIYRMRWIPLTNIFIGWY